MGLFDLFSSDTSAGDILSQGLSAFGLGGSSNMGGSPYGGLDLGVPVNYPVYSFGAPQAGPPGPGMITYAEPGNMPIQISTRALTIIPKSAYQFPLLLDYLQKRGIPWSKGVQWAWQMLKKWGPQVLSGVLGAAVVDELLQWSATKSAKRRRMNPANAKALRRSMRRLRSFDRLSARVSRQLHRGSSRRSSRSVRCYTCRKSPCVC